MLLILRFTQIQVGDIIDIKVYMEILLVLRLTQTKVGDIIDIKVYTDPG